MNRQKRFCELFCFREDFLSQNSKIVCPHSQQLPVLETQFLGFFHIFKWLLLVVLTHPEYFFLLDCSFKICEKPSMCSKNVHVVIVVSVLSMPMLIPCLCGQRQHGQWLCWHCVSVVNNYFSMSQRSQQLHQQGFMEVNDNIDNRHVQSRFVFY